MTEREKMLAGGPYDALDPELVDARAACQAALLQINAAAADDARRMALLGELLGSVGEDAYVAAPLMCDYGTHVHLGDRAFLNFGCVLLDCAEIRIGDDAQIGPGTQLLAADHPLDPAARRAKVELSAPITIGANCWLGGGVIVCPGVSIGDDTVVGAGAVVTHDLPSGVLAAGVPARVLREL